MKLIIYTIILLFFLPVISADSIVQLGRVIDLDDSDLGLYGSTIDGLDEVLAFGSESTIIIIDAVNPGNNFNVSTESKLNLTDADYHPSGNSAIIVGEKGIVLRYSKNNQDIEQVGNFLQFEKNRLETISWNYDGSWAYIGSEEGNIWRFRGNLGNTSEVILMTESSLSKITGIDCHRKVNICVIATLSNGIGIIDATHKISWIGGFNYPWIDVICPLGDACLAISSQNNLGSINLNLELPQESDISVTYLGEIEGKMKNTNYQNRDSNIISLIPFSLIEYNSTTGEAFSWLDNLDVREFNAEISDEIIVSTWGVDEHSGWILTSSGKIINYDLIESNKNNEIIDGFIMILIMSISGAIIYSIIKK